jgi:hypothetical protein
MNFLIQTSSIHWDRGFDNLLTIEIIPIRITYSMSVL